MSAPNKNYDPVAVTALSAAEVDRALQAALAAIEAAGTLDELKEARLAHDGDKAPLRLARAEIGALPPEAKAGAGRRVGAAMNQVREAVQARQAQLERDRDEQVLVTERVDVTLPFDRTPPGARHPVTMTAERLADVFVALGYEVAEGPRPKPSGTTSTRSTSRRTTRRGRCRTRCSSREPTASLARPASCCARTPRRCRSGAC
jgi:phenylalanyl-tRNA synthetase alpha chain